MATLKPDQLDRVSRFLSDLGMVMNSTGCRLDAAEEYPDRSGSPDIWVSVDGERAGLLYVDYAVPAGSVEDHDAAVSCELDVMSGG